MQKGNEQNYLKGAAILAATTIFVKVVGAIYKIPIFNVMDDEGIGVFQTTYNVYALILTIASAGVPVALSRMISAASATGRMGLVKRYYSVALPAFAAIGVFAMSMMFFCSGSIAGLMNNSLAAPGIRVLAPAVFFICILAVYRGYTQGFQNMMPTASTQVVEVLCKAAVGIVVALWLSRRGYDTSIVSGGAIAGVTIGLGLCIPLMMWHKRKTDRRIAPAGQGEDLPGRLAIFAKLMKVAIPITIGSSFMQIMIVIDNSVVLGRIQSGLGLAEKDASALYGLFTRALTIYNFPSALVVPVSISIMPAISAALAKKQHGEARDIMRSSLKLVNLLALPAAAGIMALASPIMQSLYNDPGKVTATILTILGAASFFVCFQLISTAILQANGHERLAMISFPVGGALKIAINYYLVATPGVGIVGPAIGTFTCFFVISAMNVCFIIAKVKDRPSFLAVIAKPLLCTALMAASAYGTYSLVIAVASGTMGTGRAAITLYLAISILAACLVYAVLVIVTGTVTRDDLRLIRKGDKIADMLRIK